MAKVETMPTASPKSMSRPTQWNEEVEEAYRFQLAGYRDEIEYKQVRKTDHVDRWPHNGFIKKLIRRDGCFYYYDRTRECPDKQINKTKLYAY
ncbi:meiosis expressed 1 protein [Biomphalaria glabrata]|uniref:Meiosis expressed gene 1 protein homolog n=2 Tax=Biomphalaria TaxID=6525 RepID=A0A2C9KSP5_BIOGL|nr:meiosis expressed gene 1 protein homolog [Biomphalaria glabrata]XP_013078883.1 meiosis expressed gene 1 protein homolog [Biomphalaria glabrata]XP_013078884.1 meiosis expressed gene 1 protein homolog [Biomphalaria glabrata]KAK0063832.1 meiosis expressed 1 protein [Biomphalaria pfeifferi]KAI8729809.1 putative meiosis expressed gene 1 protein [Biomphalaria glabrata]KAI8745628.1 meiosis expressed gene 1 protein [Biomphalaria glabrata]